MNIFKSNLQLLKGTRLISGLFIFASLLVTASIIYSANTYYDIDADKIIINEAQDIIGTQTITGNTGISGITSLGDGGTTNYAQFSATGDLALIGEANLISKLDGLLTLQFDDTTGFVIKDDNGTPVSYFTVDDNGTLTLATGEVADEIVLDPAGVNAGIVRIAAGDSLYIGDVPIAATSEATLVGVIPIFGFDLPARTSSTSYVEISRDIEDFPNFPTLTDGKVRQYKFIIRYADTLNPADATEAYRVSNWQVYNTTGSVEVSTFNVTASPSTDDAGLNKGLVEITETVTIPTDTDDWDLRVKLPTASKSIQIYSIFLAAYDQLD